MSNIKSTDISIFPLAKPRQNNTSRLFYEQNVTNLLRQLMDTDGFIIQPCELDGNKCKGELIFNLYGYYFKINNGATLVDNLNGEYIIARITLTENEPVEIEGQDDNDLYTGLEIICSDNISNNNPNTKILTLFTKIGDKWEPLSSSFNKFNPQSLIVDVIDGKH